MISHRLLSFFITHHSHCDPRHGSMSNWSLETTRDSPRTHRFDSVNTLVTIASVVDRPSSRRPERRRVGNV